MFKKLHDYVKENYEAGKYQEAEEEYQHWQATYRQTSDTNSGEISDFQLGYNQAITDHEAGHVFHHYPEALVRVADKLTGDGLTEILQFIEGYQQAKEKLKEENE